MPQPSFWLKVSKRYVIENFESLIDYINRYEYSPGGDGHADFEESVECLAETAADLASECRKTEIWSSPQLGIDAETAVRILAASVLARKKTGVDDHDGVLNLIWLLLSSGVQLTPDVARSLLRLAIDCMRCRPIAAFSFSFASISKENFIPGAFAALLGATEVSAEKGRRAEFEGKGCLEVSEQGIVAAPMNLDAFRHEKLKATLEGVEGVRVVEHDEKRPADTAELIDYYGRLNAKLDRVSPSPKRQKPEYPVGARMLAEVTYSGGIKNVMRTISPDYQPLEGKLMLPSRIAYNVPRESFTSQVRVGDIFMVERIQNGDFTFGLVEENISEFMAEYGSELRGEEQWAVFMGNFRKGSGTRWLTESGMLVNVGWSVPDGINADADAQEKALLLIRESTTDNSGTTILNGAFDEDREPEVEPCDVEEFKQYAFKVFCSEYLDWSKPADLPAAQTAEKAEKLDREDVVLAGRLLEKLADDPDLLTSERIEHLTIAMTLLKMAGCMEGYAYVRHRLDYLRRIAEFAAGASPISLQLQRPEALRDVELSRLRDLVVELLRGYKEQEITHASTGDAHVPGARHLDTDTPELIRQLVDASNILIDKIDSAEIHRIKKSIASRLGVADCYHNSYDDMPYYGDETETLEFKQSCTLPPLNRRTTSATKDLEVQKYAILKGVCAFLNSPQGGDLLVGVADSGYATGLTEDIDRLHSARIIAEPTADRLRTYVKNSIDRAFTTVDGSMSGSAITADCVSCNVETPRDNIEVLRIHVKPFPWDVVKFAAPAGKRPEGLADVYSRTSGASTPMSADGIRAIKLRKTSELGNENAKLLPILEAIDEHRCVVLRNYASSSGTSDRKIEPHRILFDLKAVQAFDLTTRRMKLFKLHRAETVERSSDRWKNESLHRDFEVDIFGMMQSDEESGERVVIKLTDFALSLLREEFPGVGAKAEIAPNGAADRARYRWRLSTDIYHPAGIARFILGLKRDIDVVEGPKLKEYIKNY